MDRRGVASCGRGAGPGAPRRCAWGAGPARSSEPAGRAAGGRGEGVDDADTGGAAGLRPPAGQGASAALGAAAVAPRGRWRGAGRSGDDGAGAAARRERAPGALPPTAAPCEVSAPAPVGTVDNAGHGPARARRWRRIRAGAVPAGERMMRLARRRPRGFSSCRSLGDGRGGVGEWKSWSRCRDAMETPSAAAEVALTRRSAPGTSCIDRIAYRGHRDASATARPARPEGVCSAGPLRAGAVSKGVGR